MLNWLRSIFNPPTEVVHTSVETYRGMAKKPSQVAPTLSTFSPVVPWVTEATQLPLSAVVQPPPPPPVEDPMEQFRRGAALSGCFVQHTDQLRSNLCYTGMVSHVYASGYSLFH